ncbi:CBS domain-containing protein [Pseudomonas sp. PCH446]
MSKDVLSGTPQTTIKDAVRILMHHHIKTLPVLNEEKHIVGIISLTDIIKHPVTRRGSGLSGVFGVKKKTVLKDIMHVPVTCVTTTTHIVELILYCQRRACTVFRSCTMTCLLGSSHRRT